MPKISKDTNTTGSIKPKGRAFKKRAMGNAELLKKTENIEKFTHTVNKVKKVDKDNKIKNTYIWFRKHEAKKKPNAELKKLGEVIAQEVFRLFVPTHPKTRIVISSERKNATKDVISKDVGSYALLAYNDIVAPNVEEKKLKEKLLFKDEPLENLIRDHQIVGVGSLMILSLWVNEVDLKLDNCRLIISDNPKESAQLIKIDGDRCFAKILDAKYKDANTDITEKIISSLPAPDSYPAFNWFDVIRMKQKQDFLAGFSDDPLFRAEINRMSLLIASFPESLLKAFVYYYANTNEEAELFFNELSLRKQQLVSSVCLNDSFVKYCKTSQAIKDMNDFYDQLQTFKLTSKDTLFGSDPIQAKDFLAHIKKQLPQVINATESPISITELTISDKHAEVLGFDVMPIEKIENKLT